MSRSRFQSSSRKLEHRPRRRGLLIGGLVLAVALAASVTYVMLRSESSVATPPIVTADATLAKVVPADNAPADERTKPVARGAGEVAAAQPGLDDAALLDDHPATSPALASDASGRVPTGKPPPGAFPAVPQSAAPADGAAGATPEVPPRPTQEDAAVEFDARFAGSPIERCVRAGFVTEIGKGCEIDISRPAGEIPGHLWQARPEHPACRFRR